jgi:ABC-type branched-subunit amino acid transport system substrate-binding protein
VQAPPPPPPVTAPLPPVTVTPLGPAVQALPPGAKVKVAMLLPLSGPNAGLGQSMLDAAQMALFDIGDEHLILMPHDTQGNPAGAAAAAQAALNDGANLILGPLLAAEVEAVKPIARQANVAVVAFSTATQLAGDGTFLMGFLPRQDITRVTSFAHDRGAHSFAALAPSTPYGQLAVSTFKDAVAAGGGTIADVQFYDPGASDLSGVIKTLAHDGGFDALLLPEGGNRLTATAPLLPYNGIDPAKVHLIGTGLWDDPRLGAEPALVGGWYAAPSPAARAQFEAHFQQLYNHKPPRLATLGYDAAALAAVLAQNPKGADFSVNALTNPSGFAGVDGLFRFRADGLVQRGLAVLEVHRDGPSVVSPAPETFQDLSF